MTATEQRLIEVLTKGLRLHVTPEHPISADTIIFGGKGLGLDSVDVLEIAVILDREFGVVLEEQNQEVHDALYTIGTLAAYIDRHRAPK